MAIKSFYGCSGCALSLATIIELYDINNINHIRQLVMELGTDEHAKKIIFLERMTEFYLSYVRVLLSMGSSASMEIRTSVYC